MSLEIVRRVRGNLQGSTDISFLEDRIISHEAFQRLRRIKQTAFLSLVFPGASHTRFEHSLGVMHQAGIAWNKLIDNQRRLKRVSERYPSFAQREKELPQNHGLLAPTFAVMEEVFSCDYTYQALRLAALLHDLGHPPFSHSGERFLPKISEIVAKNSNVLPNYILEYLDLYIDKYGSDKRVSHEVMTILLIDKVLKDIYKTASFGTIMVEPQDVISILIPEITPTHLSPLCRSGVYKLCHELVSGEIDIDRMDYLRRDSQECGVVYGIFDLDRIMDSLSLYSDTETLDLHLAIQYSGLAAFEDYLRARQSMYVQLYFHKTSVAAEAMLQAIDSQLKNFSLSPDLNEYLNTDEWSISSRIIEYAKNSLSPQNANKVERILLDLLYKRKLWKRVYEVTNHNVNESLNEMEIATSILKKNGISFEQIFSSVTLTNFKTRKKNSLSENYLRLIKKDGRQFLRVVPIEDYSQLIANKSVVEINRIYVDTSVDEDRANKAKEALTKGFSEF